MTPPPPDPRFAALVLAGDRRGASDPVAALAGRSHKAVVPVLGRPMIAHVVDALLATPSIGEIRIAIEDRALVQDLPELRSAFTTGRVRIAPAGPSPSLTVLSLLESKAVPLPLVVTTADHPLLTPEMIEHFLAALPSGAEVAAGVADAGRLGATYPGAIRTILRFRGGEAVTGCNLFAFRTEAAAGTVRFWSEAERYRKRPWRLITQLGIWPSLRFLFRRMTLTEAAARLSRLVGHEIGVVRMPWVEAGIDVDKPSDLVLAEGILSRREERSRAEGDRCRI